MKTNYKNILYVLPIFLILFMFSFYPLIKTIIQSFYITDPKGKLLSFNGINNYIDLFTNPIYLESLKTTVIFSIVTVIGTVFLATLLAVLVNENIIGERFFSLIFSSTMGISVASASLFWNFLFHPTMGVLNKIIGAIGFGPIMFITDPKYAFISVCIVTIWMNLGFSFIILYGGIKNIDKSYYESADLVGGNLWFRTKKITIPLLSPSLFFVLVISIINSFQSFGVVDMLTRGGPANSTNLLIYNLYNDGFVNFQIGIAASQGITLFIMIFLITRVVLGNIEKKVTYQ